ncbi:MAG: hypothetical protein QM500_15945 [Methylococcales bacterium]
MDKQNNQGNNPEQSNNRQPDSIAYNVQQGGDGKAFWNKVGAAWQHKDGKGCDIQLQSIPVNGHITLREQRNEQMKSYDNQRQEVQNNQNQQQTQSTSKESERSR